ncbi:fam-c protein [Plasmodium yoelii]|uniref:Fam-c protein n=2 Tax=Plasmodium yoelii TaxID=5861 RepID=A0AAE9WQW2_PLAYO|nr:fam-c protein [Plasmodium yoelii]WBY58285.1 fam-c protein [Plasmodium yoelii yoelii]CDS44078.1 fam-c protein [Plasmodium yoelii]VTZ79203.1 fam-c protein [Plasmodium yoelii]|eukprot:XP_022811105.2 fam-c protein [Plasmodium yoelii]
MNKRIFSLVCIVLYSLLAVSVHCFEQKVYDVRNKSIRGTKDRNKSNETQLKNNNPKDDEDDREFNCFGICKKNKQNKQIKTIIRDVPLTFPHNQIVVIYSSNESLPTVKIRIGTVESEFIPKDQKHLEDILKLQKTFEKLYPNSNESRPKETMQMEGIKPELIPKKQEDLKDILQLKETSEKIYSNNDKSTSKEIFQMQQNLKNIRENNPKLFKILLESKEPIEKCLLKKKPSK